VARGAVAARDTSLVAYAADIVALNAVATNQAKNEQATDEALVEDLAFRQGNVSGVNVDEELSKLVLYQQAYSVSARIVSITNQLFDDLMSIGR
jgi:flagellar hook-associated protein 1